MSNGNVQKANNHTWVLFYLQPQNSLLDDVNKASNQAVTAMLFST